MAAWRLLEEHAPEMPSTEEMLRRVSSDPVSQALLFDLMVKLTPSTSTKAKGISRAARPFTRKGHKSVATICGRKTTAITATPGVCQRYETTQFGAGLGASSAAPPSALLAAPSSAHGISSSKMGKGQSATARSCFCCIVTPFHGVGSVVFSFAFCVTVPVSKLVGASIWSAEEEPPPSLPPSVHSASTKI